ncbi:hypothetical protein A9L43_25095 [Pseudomonas mosselii]|uniref:hypothetical protein n=1 Tax=Pseudomonas mosselii TaxID=78327 RepID=UPI00083CBEF9|nr:hypothetical protein [Pseudomonas mosselii]ODB35540.1 hypothetical protein A9L43_25095 [Pseudomonas mosselii]
MKRLIVTAAVTMMLTGCAGQVWKATGSTDEFTDQATMMVTVGEYTNVPVIVTKPFNYYPVVRKVGNEVYVGLMSGGRIKVPVGTVQLRIDQHEAWTISPQETPVSLLPEVPQYALNLPPEQAELVKNAQAQAMTSAAQAMSPYTVTGGDKAKAIIKQMAAGHMLKYRTVGLNQAGSTTGEVTLDASFVQSLKQVGIDTSTW